MAEEEKIKELMKRITCDRSTAQNLLAQFDDVEEAEHFFLETKSKFKKLQEGDKKIYNYTGSNSQTATINTKLLHVTLYSNGLKINDNFFSYDSEVGRRLKVQIENKELDPQEAMISGFSGEEVAVEIINKENEFYGKKEHPKEFRALRSKEVNDDLVVPSNLSLGSNEVRIKLFINSEGCIVNCSSELRMSELKNEIRKFKGYRNEKIVFFCGEKKICDDEGVKSFNGAVIKVHLE